MKYALVILISILIHTTASLAQKNIGTPKIINFSHFDMGAGTQNWGIEQDRFGNIYIANNSGLITYNGKQWKNYPLPNHTITRSVKIDASTDRIYVGAQGIVGYFMPNDKGLDFHNITNIIPEKFRNFGDVWNIEILNGKIYFRTSNHLLIYHHSSFTTIEPDNNEEFTFMGQASGRLLVADKSTIYELKDKALINLHIKAKSTVTSAITLSKDSVLLLTNHHDGILLHNNMVSIYKIADEIKNSQINTASLLDNNRIILGTTSNGIYMITKAGKIIQNINTDDGIRNNIVLASFIDQVGTLWLGLDNGMTLIDIQSAIRNIYPDKHSPLATYATIKYHNKLFLGTSDGLFYTDINTPNGDINYSSHGFKKINNTNGQVWGLDSLDDRLYMFHNNGTFEIKGIQVEKKLAIGSWLMLPSTHTDQYYAGTYNGILSVAHDFKDVELMGRSLESMRFAELDRHSKVLWTSHPYRGIFKYNLDKPSEEPIQYNQKKGLPSENHNYVYTINEEVVVATQDGIYSYNPESDSFFRNEGLNKLFGNIPIIYLKDDRINNIWFISNEKIGVLDKSTREITYFPELEKNMIGGFYHINPIDAKNILVGSYNGVFHINYESYKSQNHKPHLSFNSIRVQSAHQDSTLQNGYFLSHNKTTETQPYTFQLAPNINNITFEIAAHEFLDASLTYAYKLDDLESEWSNWTAESTKIYGNLPAGVYVFRAKSLNRFGQESDELTYQFEIKNYWYAGTYAKVAYLFLLLGSIYLLIQFYKKRLKEQKHRYEEKQKQINYLHDLEIKNNERLIIELKNEKLENEINYKNKELATITMHAFKRSRLINKIKEDINFFVNQVKDRQIRSELDKILKVIIDNDKQRLDWEQFAMHFDDVHNNFLKNMKQQYPDLTATDLKLCAYLKINMSSKEISQILNISLKGVEVARYRLRKKLQLHTDVNLNEFLNKQ